jgi:glycosyltransferase involved in cell wall biosynthesis
MAQIPLVSVVMPTHNNRAYICAAIDSCLNQTWGNLEIIVVDDGSGDGTGDLLRERYGERIRYLYQQNAGPGIARNSGIQAARGDYIKFCDSDDLLYPEHVTRCMAIMQGAGENVAVVYTRYRFVDDAGVPIPDKSDPPLLDGDIFCRLLLSNSNAILTSATLVRKSALIQVGLFPADRDLRHSEDWDLFLRLAAQYHYATVPEILLDYRWHRGGLTSNQHAAAYGRLKVVQMARHYAGRERCIDDRGYDRMEAGRCHVVAMMAWRSGDRAQARQMLRQALRLEPQAQMRRVYLLLAYLLPYGVVPLLDRILRGRRG